MERTYEMKTSKARLAAGRLLSELLSLGKMEKDLFRKGYVSLFDLTFTE